MTRTAAVPTAAAALGLVCFVVACSADDGMSADGSGLRTASAAMDRLMPSARAALESSAEVRTVQYPGSPGAVHCATRYLGENRAQAPGGMLYVWALCEADQVGALSAPFRLIASPSAAGSWIRVETLPDDASDAEVVRLFPPRLRGAARGGGIDVDALERALEARRSTPTSGEPTR